MSTARNKRMRPFLVFLAMVGAVAVGVACGQDDTLTLGAQVSPTPSAAKTVTATPPPCSNTVGPPPNVTTTSLDCGNANYAVPTADTFDGDGDAFICVWTCTAEPNPDGTMGPAHEELQTWNLTAEDGDMNSLVSTTNMPCCTWVP